MHVLRTDSGGEYQNVDLFCKKSGVARQRSEARNQASNGKDERMHRIIMNMARCMIFASGLPLNFWGDAVEYAAYILNRAPTNSNAERMSPMKVLTDQTPSLGEIVVFGSPGKCTDILRRRILLIEDKKGLSLALVKKPKGIVYTCRRIKWLLSRSMFKILRH